MRGRERESDRDREATRERETCNMSNQGRVRGGERREVTKRESEAERERDNDREATTERERDMQHE